jgi:osmotically-inducible protein OsmY
MKSARAIGRQVCCAAAILCIATLAIVQAGQQPAVRAPADDVLKARVVAALAAASDVPGRDIAVDVKSGVVTLKGRVSANSMRGVTYPTAMMQQSIGAVVRAVPGVKEVRFEIQVDPGKPAGPA